MTKNLYLLGPVEKIKHYHIKTILNYLPLVICTLCQDQNGLLAFIYKFPPVAFLLATTLL